MISCLRNCEQGSTKFKRLKKAGRGSEEERSGFSDEEESDKDGRSGRTAEEKLKRSLFGDDEGKFPFQYLNYFSPSANVSLTLLNLKSPSCSS